jgi:hypothetical protein
MHACLVYMHGAMSHLQPPAALAWKCLRRSIAELQRKRWFERTVKLFIMSCESSPSGIGSPFGALHAQQQAPSGMQPGSVVLRNSKHRLICNLALSSYGRGRPRHQTEQT